MSFLPVFRNGVTYYRSTVLPCPHAFSTRLGGVSLPSHLRSMNFGSDRGDDPSSIKENLRRICLAADLPQTVVSAHQIHSTEIFSVSEVPEEPLSGDGFCTKTEGLTLLVKVADCIPLLLCDKESKTVMALHAGWRGSAANIAGKGVERLISLGAQPKNIVCAVGTGIGVCCFEVKEDFISEFTALLGTDLAGRFLSEKEGRFFADIKGLNKELLLLSGLSEENIDVSPLCTCCRPDLFFSHRASHGVRGTMGAFIASGNAER